MAENESTEVALADDPAATAENNGALAINADAVPEGRRFAADSIRAPLPPAVYERLGQMTLTTEQEHQLDQPLPEDEVDIRPDDGAVYASHEYYRRKLNAVFGRMGWTLIPGSPLAQEPNTKNYYRVWILFVGGVYVSEAMASRAYYAENARMSLDDVAEAIKSDALRRCCKDLGIATECWNKRWTEKWRKEHAVQVIADVRKQGQTMKGKLWRRKDADPLPGEASGGSSPPNTTVRQPEASRASSASPPAETQQPKAAAPLPKPAPKPAPAAAPKPAVAAKPVTMVPDPKPTSTPRLLDSQIRLLFARGRNAGLIVGEDASPMMEFLTEFGIAVVSSDGKTSTENCNATMKNIPPNQFTTVVKKLDELAKAAKPADSGDAEKI